MPTGKERRPVLTNGFAYLLLLTALAVLAGASSLSLNLGAAMTRRVAEEELLAIGAEYEQALTSYRSATPIGGRHGNGPRSLNELLKDTRYPVIKRHLRRVYPDPLTGRSDWGVVVEPNGSIAGVYSLAQGVPIKKTSFPKYMPTFENATSYRQWVFGPGDGQQK